MEIAAQNLAFACTQEGLRAVLFGVSNVLLGTDQADRRALSERLFERLPLDPSVNPLRPLLKSDPGASIYARDTVEIFLAGGSESSNPFVRDLGRSPWSDFCASFYAPYRGDPGVSGIVQGLRQAGLAVALWDDCLSGSTHILRSRIEQEYGNLFADDQFFSTDCRSCLGEAEFLEKVLRQLGVTRKEALLVTGNLGFWDYAVREGLRTCFFRLFEGTSGPNPLRVSLLQALGVGEDGAPATMTDPVAYLQRLKTFSDLVKHSETLETLREAEKKTASLELFQKHLRIITGLGPFEAELKAAYLDWLIWTGNDSYPPLATVLQNFPMDSDLLPLPRYKSTERLQADFTRIFRAYWRQIEDSVPPLASRAFSGLLDEFDLAAEISRGCPGGDHSPISHLWGMLREKLAESSSQERLTRLGLLTVEECKDLTRVFQEDDAALDSRYAAWVTGVVGTVRDKVSLQRTDEEITDYVEKSVKTGAFYRLMTMEMDVRGQSSPVSPFIHRHDMRAVVSVLLLNREMIRLRGTDWRTYARRGSVREWIEAMLFPLIGIASPQNVHLEIAFTRGGRTASIPLSAFPEAEREALGHVLTELVRNGIKYRNPDARQSKISVRVVENEGHLEITVTDNGVGIRDIEKVWESGIRERPDLAEGDGDGLPSILRHVSAWDWDLKVGSKVGEGCKFILAVPIRS